MSVDGLHDLGPYAAAAHADLQHATTATPRVPPQKIKYGREYCDAHPMTTATPDRHTHQLAEPGVLQPLLENLDLADQAVLAAADGKLKDAINAYWEDNPRVKQTFNYVRSIHFQSVRKDVGDRSEHGSRQPLPPQFPARLV